MINPQFDEASQFIDDVAIVKSSDKYGLIDKEGKFIVNPQFESIAFDVFTYLVDYSIKSNISSDYLDVNAILKVICNSYFRNLSNCFNFIKGYCSNPFNIQQQTASISRYGYAVYI